MIKKNILFSNFTAFDNYYYCGIIITLIKHIDSLEELIHKKNIQDKKKLIYLLVMMKISLYHKIELMQKLKLHFIRISIILMMILQDHEEILLLKL